MVSYKLYPSPENFRQTQFVWSAWFEFFRKSGAKGVVTEIVDWGTQHLLYVCNIKIKKDTISGGVFRLEENFQGDNYFPSFILV